MEEINKVKELEEVVETKELSKPLSEEDFKEKAHEIAVHNYQQMNDDFENGILHLRDYSGVRKYKSIRRAIRKGLVSIYGEVYPKRPFNNKKRGKGSITYRKRRMYEQFTHKNRAVC